MPTHSPYTLVAFLAYMVGVFLLGILSHKLLQRGSFLKEYFLGDRKLNAWVLSLTYVATSVSAGSLVGFPSLIYRYGWIMALWIAGYMIGGLVSKGVLAKRLNQVSRFTGAITVPDVLRDRFQSPALGLLASSLLLIFLLFNLVAQFKAGGLILQQTCAGIRETAGYQHARTITADTLTSLGIWSEAHAAEAVGTLQGANYPDYVLGILVFSLTVVAYTTYGGFWAVTWTDVLQGLMIVGGALLLMFLAVHKVGGLGEATARLRQIDPDLLTGPGPENYMGPSLAISFFVLYTLGLMGQPVGMVRLMACRDTPTLRRSLFMITIFYALIYLPLIVAFICARALYPTEFARNPDTIMPAMALLVTQDWPVVGGLILAAPYAAAMSAVAGYLLLMSSSLVRDIYQRNINVNVSQAMVKRISYVTTATVGIVVTAGALWPPKHLQILIIFTGAGMACTYLAPTVLALYWRRATKAGALTALISGFMVVAVLSLAPAVQTLIKGGGTELATRDYQPIYVFGFDPVIYGLVASFALGILVSLITKPLPKEHLDRYFLEAK
jgi:SSS family solute:Na+ symporter/sodium/pantothenate symporter